MMEKKGIILKIIMLWLVILVVASFSTSVRSGSDHVSIQVVPEVPRAGEPVIVAARIV